MKIILKNEYTKDDLPKEIIVYKNNKLIKVFDMKIDNEIMLNREKLDIKILIKNNMGKNIRERIIVFIISIVSILFGINGEEVFNNIYEYAIEFKGINRDIEIMFTGDLERPFISNCDISRSYTYVEETTYKKWVKIIMLFLIAIGLALATCIFSIKNIFIKTILALIAIVYFIYGLNKIYSAKRKIKK